MRATRGCPTCGSTDTRPMSNREAGRYYGEDRFVLVRPRVCRACRAAFEPPPGRGGALLTVACGGVGVLLGAACVAPAPVLVWYALAADGGTPFERARMLACVPLVVGAGAFLVRGGRRVVARGRTGSSRPPPPADPNRV